MLSLAPSSQPLSAPSAGLASIGDLLTRHLDAHAARVATRHDDGDRYVDTAFCELVVNARALARWLQHRGASQRVVATLCKNRPEWDLTALATLHTANIICPLDTTLNSAELDRLIGIRAPDFWLVSRGQLPRIRELQARFGFRADVLVADLHTCFEDLGQPTAALAPGENSLAEILRDFADGPVPAPSALLEDPATILGHYATSGTTSLPRLVRISHGNIIAAVGGSLDIVNLRPNEDVLNIGPYTHIATLMEFLVTKTRGFTVSYMTREPDEDDVLENELARLSRRGVRVKALMAVPKFWIHLLKEVLEELKDKPVLWDLFDKLCAIEKHGHLHNLGTLDKAKLTATRLLLRNKLGGYFSYGISSSTKLDHALVEIFGKLGITVLDIYGATECTGIIARSRLNDIHPGTSGKILPTLEWRIAEPRRLPEWPEPVGMLELRGPTIAAGYLGAGDASEPLPGPGGGWLSTGDLAWVDGEARVHLVGRQNELIAWPGGWLLDPQHISNLVARGVFVKDAMVVHARPEDSQLSVAIFPDWPRLRRDSSWQHDLAVGIPEDQALKTRLVEAIRYAASLLEIPAELDTSRVWILERKLDRTPTHKIKYVSERSRLHEARCI